MDIEKREEALATELVQQFIANPKVDAYISERFKRHKQNMTGEEFELYAEQRANIYHRLLMRMSLALDKHW